MGTGNNDIFFKFLKGGFLGSKGMLIGMIPDLFHKHNFIRSDFLDMLESVSHDTIGTPCHDQYKKFVAGILGKLLFAFGGVRVVRSFGLGLVPHGGVEV
jgi:hypothetical protein